MGAMDLPQWAGKTDLLESKEESGTLAQFVKSAVYSGVESPVRAVAQIIDQHTAASKSSEDTYDAAVQSGFKKIGVEQPRPAEFNTKNWYVQQAGGAVGMMAPFLLLRAGVQSTAAKFLGETALNGAGTTLAQFAGREALLSGATGLAYGAIFSPSKESNVGTSSFYADRAKNGIGDMVSFAALSLASPYIGKGLNALAAPLENSAISPLAKNLLEGTLRGPVLPGIASGIPGGFISAEIGAWKDGRTHASRQEIVESMVGMSFVGGAMGTAAWLSNRRAAEKLTEPTIAPETLKQTIGEIEPSAYPQAAGRVIETKAAAATEAPVYTQRREPQAQARDASSKTPELKAVPDTAPPKVPPANEAFARLEAAGRERHEVVGPRESKAVSDASIAEAAAKVVSDKLGRPANAKSFDIVLGASGVEAPAHVGFLRALEERHVPIDKIYGASGGALVATFYANGYTPAQLNKILLSNEFRYPSASILAKCFHVQDPWNLFPSMIDFKPFLQEVVQKYGLKPQDNLKIVAADANTHQPYVFEGKNYDLPTALAASTAATTIGMKAVRHEGQTLIDGVYYHPIPAELAQKPAIVSKIGFANKLPTAMLSPWDYMMHLREMAMASALEKRFPDPKGHLIAETGLRDVSTSTFGASVETLNRLIEHGYQATKERLSQPDALETIGGNNPPGKK